MEQEEKTDHAVPAMPDVVKQQVHELLAVKENGQQLILF
jgi:hypothetical protein